MPRKRGGFYGKRFAVSMGLESVSDRSVLGGIVEANSARPMTTATSFMRRLTNCPRSISTASELCQAQGNKAPRTVVWVAVCADAIKSLPQGARQASMSRLGTALRADLAVHEPLASREIVAEVPLNGYS